MPKYYINPKKIVKASLGIYHKYLKVCRVMTDIREVLATNLKKFRQARGLSQAKLAEKVGTSTQYIGMLEIKGKFPSSEMVHKLASALEIDPKELFYKEIDPETMAKNAQRMALGVVGGAVNQFLSNFIAENLKKLDEKSDKKDML
jgi:transcriptional regulator with XRE-family HTH domain